MHKTSCEDGTQRSLSATNTTANSPREILLKDLDNLIVTLQELPRFRGPTLESWFPIMKNHWRPMLQELDRVTHACLELHPITKPAEADYFSKLTEFSRANMGFGEIDIQRITSLFQDLRFFIARAPDSTISVKFGMMIDQLTCANRRLREDFSDHKQQETQLWREKKAKEHANLPLQFTSILVNKITATETADRHPIFRLPYDVLKIIFSHCLPHNQPDYIDNLMRSIIVTLLGRSPKPTLHTVPRGLLPNSQEHKDTDANTPSNLFNQCTIA